jgi:hypothetical protein
MFARVLKNEKVVIAEPRRRRRAHRLWAANPVPWEPRPRRARWRRFWRFAWAFVAAVEGLFNARIVRNVAPGARPLERWEFENESVKIDLRNF